MKLICVTALLCFFFSIPSYSQSKNVGIGTNSPNTTALLDLDVSDGALFPKKLGLLIPRMSATERDDISTPALSLLIFNTTSGKYEYYTGSTWAQLLPAGDVSFTLLQSGTNVSAAMKVGSGASLAPTGSGTVASNIFIGDGSTSNAVDLASGEINGALTFGNGGTGQTAIPANGQLLIGNGAGYSLANLTAGSNIAIANSAGGIQISASGLESVLNFQSPLSRSGSNVSIPPADAEKSGYLSSADWSNFSSKENSIAPGLAQQYWRGDKTWQTLNSSAVAEGTNLYYTDARARAALSAAAPMIYNSGTGAFSVAANTDETAGVVASGEGHAQKVWKTDASGVPAWRDDAAGTGTVTSVALSLPAQFSVAGSPVTNSGTLSVNWQNEAANAFLAGPASGAAGTPTFRTLEDADIPDDITITGYLPLAGGSLSGSLNMSNQTITNIGSPGTYFTNDGSLYLEGNLIVGNNISILGMTTFETNVLFNQSIVVKGNTKLDGTLITDGDVTANQNLEVRANATIDQNLEVKGNTKLDGTLITDGDVTANQNLEVRANTTIDQNLEVKGNTKLDGTLIINGKTGFGTDSPLTQADINGAIAIQDQTPTFSGSELQVGNSSFIKIDQAGTFTLSGGLRKGHYLVLESVVNDVILSDGGNLALSGNWDSDAMDVITLIWDGLQWVELSRSINH